MGISVGAQPGINNPGNLLYGVGWNGQGAPYSSPNGLTYATFNTPQDGVNALYTDLTTAINNGNNTLSGLVYHYLGTSSNNAQNPNVANYLTAVSQATGIAPGQSISAADVPNLAAGIATAEGTISAFPQLAANAAGGGLNGSGVAQGQQVCGLFCGVGQWVTNPGGAAGNFVTGLTGISAAVTGQTINGITPGAAVTAIGQTATGTGQELTGIGSAFANLDKILSTAFSADTWTRIAVVGIAIVLLIGALILLNKGTIIEGAKTAALAA